MTRNSQGLGRAIPAKTKREVRQRCGFGCVVCGNAFVEYHHTTTRYAAAASHDPSQITLLCGTCHSYVTRGQWSDEKIEEANAKPFCITHRGSHASLDIGATPPTVLLGGNRYTECIMPIRIHDYPIILLRPPEDEGGPARISALFTDSSGTPQLIISNNEVTMRASNWDATATGKQFKIWESARAPSLTLTVEPRRSVSVDRIESTFLGWRISANDDELRISDPSGVPMSTMSRCVFHGSAIGVQLGEPRF